MKRSALRDKTAIVFGACGGIGGAIVRLLDEKGVKLALSDIAEKELKLMAQDLSQEPLIKTCDITEADEIKALYEYVVSSYGKIDIMINTVGIIYPSLFESTTYGEISKQIDVNLLGIIKTIKELIPLMKKQGGGHIVIISSLAGIVPETYSSIYTATKFALRGLNLTLNLELKQHNIEVSTIFPDSVDTPMLAYEAEHGGSPLTFLDEPIRPEKVADAVLKAILKKKVEVCVPKGMGRISKFIMCFPKLVQRIWPKMEKKGEEGKQKFLETLAEKNNPKKKAEN